MLVKSEFADHRRCEGLACKVSTPCVFLTRRLTHATAISRETRMIRFSGSWEASIYPQWMFDVKYFCAVKKASMQWEVIKSMITVQSGVETKSQQVLLRLCTSFSQILTLTLIVQHSLRIFHKPLDLMLEVETSSCCALSENLWHFELFDVAA